MQHSKHDANARVNSTDKLQSFCEFIPQIHTHCFMFFPSFLFQSHFVSPSCIIHDPSICFLFIVYAHRILVLNLWPLFLLSCFFLFFSPKPARVTYFFTYLFIFPTCRSCRLRYLKLLHKHFAVLPHGILWRLWHARPFHLHCRTTDAVTHRKVAR